jgi:hypothetical protein
MNAINARLHHLAHSPAVEHTAWVFYTIAAVGSSIGQIWVGVTTAPWPDDLTWQWRAVFVLPFAIVIDLGGVVCSAFADWRRRLGEAAYGWRTLSAFSVTGGVAINIIGHAGTPYLAAVFGGLGCFAYAVWIMHSGARRRDALRAAGKLGTTPPVYGLAQWRREPAVTRLARSLALQQGLGLHESLHAARQQIRDEHRRSALRTHIDKLIRSTHKDPVIAAIAVTNTPIDVVADRLIAACDVDAWVAAIATKIKAPATAASESATAGLAPAVPVLVANSVLKEVPADQASYDQWRTWWTQMQQQPGLSTKEFADKFGLGVRTAQRVRKAGAAGLLNSEIPLVARVAQLAHTRQMAALNGHELGDLTLTAATT